MTYVHVRERGELRAREPQSKIKQDCRRNRLFVSFHIYKTSGGTREITVNINDIITIEERE